MTKPRCCLSGCDRDAEIRYTLLPKNHTGDICDTEQCRGRVRTVATRYGQDVEFEPLEPLADD